MPVTPATGSNKVIAGGAVLNAKGDWFAVDFSKPQTVRGVPNNDFVANLRLVDCAMPGIDTAATNYNSGGNLGSGVVPKVVMPLHRKFSGSASGDYLTVEFAKELLAAAYNANMVTETEAGEGPLVPVKDTPIPNLYTCAFLWNGEVWIGSCAIANLSFNSESMENPSIKFSFDVAIINCIPDSILYAASPKYPTPYTVYPASQLDDSRTGLTWHDIHINIDGDDEDIAVKSFNLAGIARNINGDDHSAGRGLFEHVTGGTYQDPTGGIYKKFDRVLEGGNVWVLMTALNAASGATVFPGSPTANQTATGTEGTWQYFTHDVLAYQPNEIFYDGGYEVTLEAKVLESSGSLWARKFVSGTKHDIVFWIAGIRFELNQALIDLKTDPHLDTSAFTLTFTPTETESAELIQIYGVRPAA